MAQTGIHEELLIGRRKRRQVPAWLAASAVFLVIAASICTITWTFYVHAQKALIEEIHDGLLRTAAIALKAVDPEVHRTFVSPAQERSPEYQAAIAPLADILEADSNVAYVYSAILRDGKVYFVLDATPAPEDPNEEDTSVSIMEEYETPPADLLTSLRQARRVVSQPYTDQWGTFISAYQPFFESDGRLGGVVGIDLSVENYLRRLKPVRNAALAAAGAGILIALLMSTAVIVIRKTDRTARDLARQLRMTNSLLAVSRAMGSTVSLTDLLPTVVQQMKSIFGTGAAALHLVAGQRLTSYSADGPIGEPNRASSGLLGSVLDQRRPLRLAKAGADPRFDPRVDHIDDSADGATLIMPIMSGDTIVALMHVADPSDADAFADDETLIIAGAVGSQILAAIDRARLAEAYVEKLKLDESLKLAASIQMSMLSKQFPPPHEGAVELHASLLPAKQIGGDFYDFFWLDDQHLAFLVADVSGKGVPAALFMAKAKTIIKVRAASTRDPGEILALANDDLSDDNDNGMFVTLLLGILDVHAGVIEWGNAGHTPAYRLPADGGAPEQIPLPYDIALGVMDGMPFETTRQQLVPGERVFLYTDGVNEAMNVDNEQFDYPRLVEVLGTAPLDTEGTDTHVIQAVAEFAAGAEQSDDLTVLSLRWRGV